MYVFRPIPLCEIIYFQCIEIPQLELTSMLLRKNDNRVCLSQAVFLTEKNMSPHIQTCFLMTFGFELRLYLALRNPQMKKYLIKDKLLCCQILSSRNKSKEKRLAYPCDGWNFEARSRKLLSKRQIVLNDHGTIILIYFREVKE